MANLAAVTRRLSELEALLGGDGGDYGPHLVVVITRYWRPEGDAVRAAADEQARIDAAVETVRQEARARRQDVPYVFAKVYDDGTVTVTGMPWDGARDNGSNDHNPHAR
jgi:hypothetical protein